MDTPILKLPMIVAAQAQKHVTHNEALMIVDSLLHLSVVEGDLTDPPASPVAESRYIVGENATGDWAGQDNAVAVFQDGGWKFYNPVAGWTAYAEDSGEHLVFNGTEWAVSQSSGGGSGDTFSKLGINTASDPTARLSVKSQEVALSHEDAPGADGGSLRVSLNRKAAVDTASFLFKTDYSGGAEIGLTGASDLAIKTSPDGSSWTDALIAKAANGDVLLNHQLLVGDGPANGNGITVSKPAPSIALRDTAGTGNSHTGFLGWRDANGVEKVWCGLGSGSNSQFTFLSHYPDGMSFVAYGGDYPIAFSQNGTDRIRIHSNGYIGVRNSNPTAPLHVEGAVRVGTYTVGSLPSAPTVGAGSIVYVSNESGGATLAFSDGSVWRRAQDRVVVS